MLKLTSKQSADAQYNYGIKKIINIFITSNNKQIGKILFDCNTIEWEIE